MTQKKWYLITIREEVFIPLPSYCIPACVCITLSSPVYLLHLEQQQKHKQRLNRKRREDLEQPNSCRISYSPPDFDLVAADDLTQYVITKMHRGQMERNQNLKTDNNNVMRGAPVLGPKHTSFLGKQSMVMARHYGIR